MTPPNPGSRFDLYRKLEALAIAAADYVIETSLNNHPSPSRNTAQRIVWPEGTHTSLLQHQQGQCMYCATRIKPRTTEIDHITPLIRNGSNHFSNLQALCRPCNRRKGTQTDSEFRQRYSTLISKTPRSIPPSHIPQSRFAAVTRQTTSAQADTSTTQNPGKAARIRAGAIVAGILTGVTTLLVLTTVGIAQIQPFLLGVIPAAFIGVGTAFSIISRARQTGVYDS